MGMRGERALLMYPPGLEFVAAFFGCHYAGVIPVPAYPPRRNRNMTRISAISEDARAAIVLSVRPVAKRWQGEVQDAPGLQQIKWLATEEIPIDVANDWVKPKISANDLGVDSIYIGIDRFAQRSHAQSQQPDCQFSHDYSGV